MKRSAFFKQSKFSFVLLIINSFIIFITMSGVIYAGELYTKISADGVELADNAVDWSCVKHKVTGQMWEKKTTVNMYDRYSLNGSQYDASSYVSYVNDFQGICGYKDWRLPTIKELNSIADKSTYDPAIDTDYFPNTLPFDYWSKTYFYNDVNHAWAISFEDGYLFEETTGSLNYIRLVRKAEYFDFFDYTKLDSDGNDLPDSAQNWSCVRDNRSGLIWEVKTDANKDDKYTVDGSSRDASHYVVQLNDKGLCNYDDWRLPAADELISIVNYSRGYPAISVDYFPKTNKERYWSASPTFAYPSYAWHINFDFGSLSDSSQKSTEYHVRLVSASLPYSFLPAVYYLLD